MKSKKTGVGRIGSPASAAGTGSCRADENGFEYVYADGTDANEDGAETFTYNTEINGYVSCRLWDFEPTNEQRMETPWKPQSTIHPAGTTEGVQ